MTTRDDVLEQMALADAHPYGPVCSSLWAEAVTWADAIEDEELCVHTRLKLAQAYYQGNEEWKSLAPFSWVVSRYEQRPDLFDAERLRLMHWNYRWAVSVAAGNPAVSVEQVHALHQGLEDFYRSQGASMHAVHGEAHVAARMMGRVEEAEAALAAWRSTPRDDNSECEGCDPTRQVVWSMLQEDWETAVATAVPVLTEEVGCDVQPNNMRSVALLALLASGRPRAAWDAHVRSYRVQRTAPQPLNYMGDHLEYLALSGRVDRGLRVLRESAPHAGEAEGAWVLRGFLIGAALVLREAVRAGRGDEPLGATITADTVWFAHPGVPATATLSEAARTVADWAMALSAQYDRRNGNTVVSQWAQRALSREPFVEVDDPDERDPLARAGAELIREGEELPEALRIGVEEEAGTGSGPLEGIEMAASLLGGPAGRGDDEADRADGADGADGADDGEDAFPVIDYRLPPVPVDEEELLTRFAAERRRPGRSEEYGVLLAAAVRWGYQQDPRTLPAELAQDCRLLRMRCARTGWDFEAARKEITAYTEHLPQDAPVVERLEATIDVLDIDTDDERINETRSPERSAERLAQAQEAAAALARTAEELLDAPAQQDGRRAQLVTAYRTATRASQLLSGLGDHDGAAAQLALASRIAPLVEDMRLPSAVALHTQLEMLEAERLLEAGDLYGACVLADEVVHRFDPCPFILAADARSVLINASLRMDQTQEAVVQTREVLNMFLAAGMTAVTGSSFGVLAASLAKMGRVLEAAEVLETALDSPLPPVLKEHLRRTRIGILDALDEDAAVLDASLEIAESALERGESEAGIHFLERAARAAEIVDENTRASQLYERAAGLVDGEDREAKVRRARLLRRAARAAVDERTLLLARTRLDTARELMARSLELLEQVPSGRTYSAEYEKGDWHDDMAWILWRTDENREALEHCAAAAEGYMSTRDRDSAARPLALAATVCNELGDEEATRQAIAQVRALLSHDKWSEHPALRHVDRLEAELDED